MTVSLQYHAMLFNRMGKAEGLAVVFYTEGEEIVRHTVSKLLNDIEQTISIDDHRRHRHYLRYRNRGDRRRKSNREL